jgi:hypothetical protein
MVLMPIILKRRFSLCQSPLVALEQGAGQTRAMLKEKAALTPEQVTLAANFTQALRESKASPKAIADACDITEQAVSNWKRTGKIARKYLPIISTHTGWSIERLLAPASGVTPNEEEAEPVHPSPTIGATILQLGALIATLNVMGRASIGPLIAMVIENPDRAAEASVMADAIAQSQRLAVRDESLGRSFGRAQKKPVETGFTPLEETR